MQFSIKAVGLLTLEEMGDFAERQDWPVVLLNDKLAVIKKNKAARAEMNFLKLGCSIARYLPPESIEEIKSMPPAETLATEIIRNGVSYRANVVCGADSRMVIIRDDESGLYSALREKYNGFSGYDVGISREISTQKAIRLKGFADVVENLVSEQLKSRSLPFFNAAEAVKGLFSELDKQKTGGYNYRLFVSGDELITEGSYKDYLLTLAVVTAICFDNCRDCVSVTLENEGNELIFRAWCDSEDTMADAFCFKSEQNLLGYTAKLLAEANLWDIDCLNETGKSGFVLRSLFVKSGEEFAIFDETDGFCALVASKVLEFGQKGIEKEGNMVYNNSNYVYKPRRII